MDVRMGLRIQSQSLTVEQISALLGSEPTQSTRRGEPVSSRHPDGRLRSITNWIFDVDASADDPTAPALDRLHPLLARLADVPAGDENRDIVMKLDGTDNGARFVIDPEDVRLLARARTGLMFDVYNESDHD